MKFIPYGKQDIRQEDIDAVVAALTSDFITQGPEIEKFETALKTYVDAQYCLAVNNGTSALHLACLALDVGPGDWVWTTPITFVASSNCALYCGAQVDFVDIDPNTWNMSAQVLEQKLLEAEKNNRLPKVVIPVHLSGLSCDMQAIKKLADRFGFSIIEDACHALGGSYQNKKIGSCEYSDIAISSFHPVKNITTAEGGCIFTNNKKFAEKMSLLRTHGITRDQDLMSKESDGPWYYEQLELGFNYRLTDIQAALGSSQIKRLPEYHQRRQDIANLYQEKLQDLPLQLPAQPEDSVSGLHLFVIRVKNGHRKALFQFLREQGIGANLHYIPVVNQPYYQNMKFNNGPFVEAETYYQEAISIPMFPLLQNSEVDFICETIRKFLTT